MSYIANRVYDAWVHADHCAAQMRILNAKSHSELETLDESALLRLRESADLLVAYVDDLQRHARRTRLRVTSATAEQPKPQGEGGAP